MKKACSVLGLFAMVLASCSIEDVDFKPLVQDDVLFYASFEQPSEFETKVYVNEDFLLRWNADDRVSIFNKNTYNQQYVFSGKTGDNAGGFRKVDTDEFVTGNAISHVLAVYPYREMTKISESEIISTTLPAEQIYSENTFGSDANTMVSVSSDNVLQFMNVGGYLVFNLYGKGVSVSSVTLKSNADEKLAGDASITFPLNGIPSVELGNNTSSEIVLICETPVMLGATAEESTQFWFVVPPTTFVSGFTVTVRDTDGNIFEKATSKSVSVSRNRLVRMTPFEIVTASVSYDSTPEAIDLGLPSGLLWSSMNIGAGKPSEIGGRYAWGETETKDYYDWDNYKWCDGSYDNLIKYCTDEYYGIVDGKTILDDEDDVAKVHWGNGWRMPLVSELQELVDYCTWTEESLDDIPGFRVTGPNGNSIFIPKNGQYDESGLQWSSEVFLWASETSGDYCAGRLEYYSYGYYLASANHKHDGLCVRPVKSAPKAEAIDLGLPSGLRWASMNVGAETPSEIGGRYAWGETETKDHYDWDNYKWCNGSYDNLIKYCTEEYYGIVDGKTVLDDEDDVAKVLWGNGWRMPLVSELQELVDYCTWTEESLDDIPGFRVTGPNGNSIFIPKNGQYDESGLQWCSEVFLWASETSGDYCAGRLEYYSYGYYLASANHKHDGLCVRPVCD